MIVTRAWLQEWINLDGFTTEEISKRFNQIGLEVDSQTSVRIPEKIVVGYVKSCEKHPDADKLNVCQVDIGTGVRQIVCGGQNVAADMYVPVATIGAVMPGGLKIKPAKLRGVDSEGMICSAEEINLPKLNDGILVLDESIGKLKLGEELNQNSVLNDDIIELELTANRGDCLSVHGVSRDLSAALNRPVKNYVSSIKEDNRLGIGRILNLTQEEITSKLNVKYKAFKNSDFDVPLKMRLRLAWIDQSFSTPMDALLRYSIHTTGVINRVYKKEAFIESEVGKAKITLQTGKHGLVQVRGNQLNATIGVNQKDVSRSSGNEEILFLETSYIHPETIVEAVAQSGVKTDELYYKTSRGSEPDLEFGMEYTLGLLSTYSNIECYAGSAKTNNLTSEKTLSLDMNKMEALIGQKVDKTTTAQILQNLGFSIPKSDANTMAIVVPAFRHDIENDQDLIEEIVRMVGIDNIKAKPLSVDERNSFNIASNAFAKRKVLRTRASTVGFYESLHFVFNDQSSLKAFGFDVINEELVLINPIVETLDTLRPTLMLGLIEANSNNIKNGSRSSALFEVGSVFKPDRSEHEKMAFIMSGLKESDGLSNSGKPQMVDFATFVQKLALVIGDFRLENAEPMHGLAHPYQMATIYKDDIAIGEVFKLHPSVAKTYDLPDTFLAEIDFSPVSVTMGIMQPYSKFQTSRKDLSLLVPKTVAYDSIEKVIAAAVNEDVKRFYPVDRFESEELGEKMSLTLRFVFQSLEKTLSEEEVTAVLDNVLKTVDETMGITLR
jgi:phenylalanyl-tRNA synthetase beta chain